jgi:3-oxoacyl-[acyl-carrier protein] reductase
MNIRDLQVLITGGGRGLGRHFAVDLASRGASVGVCDVLEADLAELQEFAARHNLAIDTYKTDVTSEQDVLDLFQAFLEKHGRVDVLINNAGITRDAFLVREKAGEIKKMSLEQWKMVIDINLTGVFLCGREAAASMVERNTKGLIINISSISR